MHKTKTILLTPIYETKIKYLAKLQIWYEYINGKIQLKFKLLLKPISMKLKKKCKTTLSI
jgi:hypothetical protein